MFRRNLSLFLLLMLVFSLALSGCSLFDKEEENNGDTEVETEVSVDVVDDDDDEEVDEETETEVEMEVVDNDDDDEGDEEVESDEYVYAPPSIDELKAALLAKHPEWEESTFETNVIEVFEASGVHAHGSLTSLEGGGGYWYAANTEDGWVIAADGNGTIYCADIEPYDFPSEMIGECFDEATQTPVMR